MKKKLFSNTVPVTPVTIASGKAVMHQMDALQTDFLADNFNVTLGTILKQDTTENVGNSENQMVRYPAHNLQQLNIALHSRFYNYVLHHSAFKDTPVLGQYKFPDSLERNYNIFILGGDKDSMFVIYENYENDVIRLMNVTKFEPANNKVMEKVQNSPVKKVSDIWNYHYNEFMGFECFRE